uniref:Vesicle transport protein n=1 Tax=Rhizochromulina marina TaxID=1034831 RepID=A0A7S2S2W5_9STRA|mmetsp:Transcript_24298/g.71365  ORF Transcript_24298/g.71365 Transcript_24298/m.71365 type:complete len:180 (+) Transcript_24298:179-718(+)
MTESLSLLFNKQPRQLVDSLGGRTRTSSLGLETEASPCPSLSLAVRLSGCATCLCLSFLLSFGALSRVMALLRGDPRPFVVTYTCSSLIGMAGSCFLTGPARQCRHMFDRRRWHITSVLLLCMLATIVVAAVPVIPARGLLLLTLLLAQLAAYILYLISYVPVPVAEVFTHIMRSRGVQ